jgi:hypothetical protein
MTDMVEAVGEWLKSETKAFWQISPFLGIFGLVPVPIVVPGECARRQVLKNRTLPDYGVVTWLPGLGWMRAWGRQNNRRTVQFILLNFLFEY